MVVPSSVFLFRLHGRVGGGYQDLFVEGGIGVVFSVEREMGCARRKIGIEFTLEVAVGADGLPVNDGVFGLDVDKFNSSYTKFNYRSGAVAFNPNVGRFAVLDTSEKSSTADEVIKHMGSVISTYRAISYIIRMCKKS